MKKVCIIPAGYKPIPPVKGGAVETIVQNMIERNEEYQELRITVLSVRNDEAEKQASNYRYTKFIFFKANYKIDKLYYWCVYKVLKKFLNIILPDYMIKKNMVNYVKANQDEFDWIIFEAGEIDCIKYYAKMLESRKIIYHSHGEVVNKKKLENSFQYYIAVSDFIKNVWNAGVKSARKCMSITLPNGVNQEKFRDELEYEVRNEKRKNLGFNVDDTVLVYVGRIVPEKGVEELLNAIRLLPDNIKLLVIGSSSFGEKILTKYETRILEMVQTLKNRIVFTGYIPNEIIGEYYQLGDISMVPSIFNDPAPLVIIESMAAGLPIITTGTGGIREYCDTNCAVFVEKGTKFEVRLAHTIKELSTDKAKMKKMGVYGKERALSFTDDMQYRNLVKILSFIS